MRHITVAALALLLSGLFSAVPTVEAGIIVTVGKSVDEDDGDELRTTRDGDGDCDAAGIDRKEFLENVAATTPAEALGVGDSAIETPDGSLVIPIDGEDGCLTFNEDTLICDDPTGSGPGSADGGGLGDDEDGDDGSDEIDALGCAGGASPGPLGLVVFGLIAALRMTRRCETER